MHGNGDRQELNGADLTGNTLWIEDRRLDVGRIDASPRIGVDYAGEYKDKPWRFYIQGNPHVSRVKVDGVSEIDVKWTLKAQSGFGSEICIVRFQIVILESLNFGPRAFPPGPGVYLYKDASGAPIYVGKARSLRSRVRSYFQDSRDLDPRLSQMLSSIDDVEFVVTDTEGEALALENNLIKQHKPRYNILLRDDKTYPYIKLTINEPYPRAMITRRVRKDGAYYAGPFFPGGLARKTCG